MKLLVNTVILSLGLNFVVSCKSSESKSKNSGGSSQKEETKDTDTSGVKIITIKSEGDPALEIKIPKGFKLGEKSFIKRYFLDKQKITIENSYVVSTKSAAEKVTTRLEIQGGTLVKAVSDTKKGNSTYAWGVVEEANRISGLFALIRGNGNTTYVGYSEVDLTAESLREARKRIEIFLSNIHPI